MPPVTVAVAVPSVNPLQEILVESKLTTNGVAKVTLMVSLSLQPLASVIVTLYSPVALAVKDWLVVASFHK